MTGAHARGRFSYAAVRVGPVWRVVCARRPIGHFTSCDLALSAAHALARQAVEAGHAAEVLLQSESGEMIPLAIGGA
jgi:hypothetical protein